MNISQRIPNQRGQYAHYIRRTGLTASRCRGRYNNIEKIMVKLFRVVFFVIVATFISSCTVVKTLKLAVNCQTDEALKVTSKAEASGGLKGQLAILEHEAVLREAGRIEEAEVVRVKRESQPGLTEKDKADAEKAILETIENIRKERKKQTGTDSCM